MRAPFRINNENLEDVENKWRRGRESDPRIKVLQTRSQISVTPTKQSTTDETTNRLGQPQANLCRASIEVWRIPEPRHPYPWRFSVTFNGKRYRFIGIPNQCKTRRSAVMRARWRAKWMEDGSYSRRYDTRAYA